MIDYDAMVARDVERELANLDAMPRDVLPDGDARDRLAAIIRREHVKDGWVGLSVYRALPVRGVPDRWYLDICRLRGELGTPIMFCRTTPQEWRKSVENNTQLTFHEGRSLWVAREAAQ